MKFLRIAFSIVLVAFSPLHALSGAAQGAVLSRDNPGQGALWGAIGAAGSEVVLESVYDPKTRAQAISEEMKARMARGELSQMLAEAGVELPQLDQGGGTRSRHGVLTRSQTRTQQGMSELFKAQVEAGLREVFIKEMRADVERSRNLVRVGMSGVALAGGVQSEQMNMMDMTASRATEENFFLQAIGIGLAVWETARIVGESWDVYQKEGAGAALAHAGAETAKEVALAVTGAKAVKLASKALKLAKASTVVGKVGEKIAGALPDAVGGLVPDAVKTTVQQAGTLVKKGANAVAKVDRKLDTAVSTQVQKLRRRGATAGGKPMAGLSLTSSLEQIESFSVKTAFDGDLYPKEKLSSLVNYLERRGVHVYGTEGNPCFVGKWNGSGQIYWPENPTILQVKHELSHYLDFKKLGVHKYVELSRYEREKLVLERLQQNRIWSDLNDLEKDFSINYVKSLKPESSLEVLKK